MNRVNPPKQVVLPVEIQRNIPLKKAFDDAYFIMFQLWKRSGGGSDFIADNSLSNLFPKINIGNKSAGEDNSIITSYAQDDNDRQFTFPAINNEYITVVVDVNFTTTETMTVVCNNAGLATVTLNDSPEDSETVTIKRLGTGNVDITSSVNIDNSTTQTLSSIYDSLTVKYIGDIGIWVII